MDAIAIVVSLIAGVFTALIAFIVSYKQRLERKKENTQQKELSEALHQSLSEAFGDYYYTNYDLQFINPTDYLTSIRNYLVHSPTLQTKTDIEEQINAKVGELKKRIEAIEARFPQEAMLEKIASVNDAIMATRLEAMSDSIKVIHDRMLTKWDVAKTVFTILSILGVLIGLILGIINLI